MVRTSITLFLHYLTAELVAYLRHRVLSVIDGLILFFVTIFGTLLLLLRLYHWRFLVSFRHDSHTEGGIFNLH